MTEPLTPPDCDLRGLPFMPLDVVRLSDSDLVALSTGDEFKAAVMLWCKAWLQVPAASVPNDDRILAHLSGAGRAWAKVKAVALRGWVLCDDGRLYHPVVAEKAREAWFYRVRQRERSAKANAVRWGTPTGDVPPSPAASPRGSPAESPAASPDDPKGQGQGKEEEEPPSQPSVGRSPRGSRLAPDWRPSPADEAFADGLMLNVERTSANFRDFWHAKAGKDAVKLDWSATWRGWCRREAERLPAGRKPVETPSKLAWMNPFLGGAPASQSPRFDLDLTAEEPVP